jgi:predicted PurR-regulated permease PerM
MSMPPVQWAGAVRVAAWSVVAAIAITALMVAKPVLMPIVLAIVLGFILSPVVQYLERRRISTPYAVAIVAGTTALMGGGLMYAAGSQLSALLHELPAHSETIKGKLVAIQGTRQAQFADVAKLWDEVTGTLANDAKASFPSMPEKTGAEESDKPTEVVVREASHGAGTMFEFAGLALEPLTAGVVVLVLVVFMLSERSDLHNRVLAIAGVENFSTASHLMHEVSDRLSRYLLCLAALNFLSAFAFGIGLFALGVPYALLIAALAGFLRFVPYMGSLATMMLAGAIALATHEGWTTAIAVVSMFVVMEFILGNFVEPWLFGRSVGLNPVGVLLAFVFWTWVWGPIGLVLAVPLTLSLVVFAKQMPQLTWLATLLGNDESLSEAIALYQRLLSGNVHEAARMCDIHAERDRQLERLDGVMVPAIACAKRERDRMAITPTEFEQIDSTAKTVLSDWKLKISRTEDAIPLTICPLDDSADHLLAQALECALPSTVQPTIEDVDTAASRKSDRSQTVRMVCVLPNHNMQRLAEVCRTLMRANKSPIYILYWKPLRNSGKLRRYLRRLLGRRVDLVTNLRDATRLIEFIAERRMAKPQHDTSLPEVAALQTAN